MQVWQIGALFAAAAIAAHYLLLRAASGRLGDATGALVLECSAAFGIFVFVVLNRIWGPPETVASTRLGFAFSVASGLCISIASVLLFFVLRRGGPVASVGS